MTQSFLNITTSAPCPFCGEFHLEIIGGEAMDVQRGNMIGPIKTDGLWIFCASCLFCGATGPQSAGKSRDEAEASAIDGWHRRVAL